MRRTVTAKKLTALFALLAMALVALQGCAPLQVDTTGLSPEQARVVRLKAQATTARTWLNDALESYKSELAAREAPARQAVHARVWPIFETAILALDAADVAIGRMDGAAAEGELAEFSRVKTRLLSEAAKLAIKLAG